MTRVTLQESPTRLWSWAGTAECIGGSRAEQQGLQNNGTGSCRVVKDSRRWWWRGVWVFSVGNNPGKWGWLRGFFHPPPASCVGQELPGVSWEGGGGPASASSAFSLCLYTYITGWKKCLCIPDRDNEIHSGQGERGWRVRQHKQPKPRPWLCTSNSPAVPHHCHTPLHPGIGFLQPPPLPPTAPSLPLCPVPEGNKVHLGRRNSSAWDLLRIFKIPFSLEFFTSNWFDKRFDLCIPLINSEDCSPPPSTLTVNILQMLCSFFFYYSQLATLLARQRIPVLVAKQPFSL